MSCTAVPAETRALSLGADPVATRAKRAVTGAFLPSGFAFASWASRVPQVRQSLDLSPGALGLVLLAIACGSILALPLAGIIVTRLGTARTVSCMSSILAAGLATAAVGQHYSVVPVVIGLFLLGFGNGTWDVAMNVAGASVEQRLRRSIMSRFHAAFSLGTVAGALLGTAMVALRVPVMAHLLAVAGGIALVVPVVVRPFLGAAPYPADRRIEQAAGRHPLRAWGEPRTLLIGLLVLTMAFSEGTGNDWLGIAIIDGYRAPAVLGLLTFAVFLAAMTGGRWFGPPVLDRYGRVSVLRVSAGCAFAGLFAVSFGGSVPVSMAGAALWGLGTALGFPVGMSAAADDPLLAAGRVSVVASIGYVAFLAGPPLIGFLGNRLGVLHALTAAAGLLAVGLLSAGATRPVPMGTGAAVR